MPLAVDWKIIGISNISPATLHPYYACGPSIPSSALCYAVPLPPLERLEDMKALLVLLLCLQTTPLLYGKSKRLTPLPSEAQKVEQYKDAALLIRETKNGIHASAALYKEKDIFKVWIFIANLGDKPFDVVQEKMFLLNAYGKVMYRFTDYELKRSWAALASVPMPPPPPPRTYYTVQSSGQSTYSVNQASNNYYSVDGVTNSTATIQEHADYTASALASIGDALQVAHNRRAAKKAIDVIDELYLQNRTLPPHGDPGQGNMNGILMFAPSLVSDKGPLSLVLFIDDQQFTFKFESK